MNVFCSHFIGSTEAPELYLKPCHHYTNFSPKPNLCESKHPQVWPFCLVKQIPSCLQGAAGHSHSTTARTELHEAILIFKLLLSLFDNASLGSFNNHCSYLKLTIIDKKRSYISLQFQVGFFRVKSFDNNMLGPRPRQNE